MGSNQFQSEYIEYLERCNTDLMKRINEMKENNESRLVSKELSKEYLISTLEDALKIFTVIPQEIDLFFEKISAALEAFKNILLKKSQMVQLKDKISKALNSYENLNNLVPVNDPVMKDQFTEFKMGKKGGTVQVSSMINSHIISKEPRNYLSRIPGVFASGARSEMHQLSPIIEASPDTSPVPSGVGSHILKEIKIPLERINRSKMSYNYISEESPKTRFKGPKLWKKSLSSNKRQSDCQRKSIFSENSENLNKKISIGETDKPDKPESTDPLEGSSWLCDDNSNINSSFCPFINYRRRKHRFATVFDKDEDFSANVERKPKKSLRQDDNECFGNHKERTHEGGIKDRLSETSVDFISTSYSSEGSDNGLSCEKTRQSKRRRRTNQPSDEKVSTGKKKDSRGKSGKSKGVSETPVYSGSSDEEDIERKKFIRRSLENRKSSGKSLESLHGRMLPRCHLSFEKTPDSSKNSEREIRAIKRSKDSKRDISIKGQPENAACAQLGDCVDEEKKFHELSQASEKKKPKKSKSKSKSRSPAIIFQENEGRLKRKAAPTILREPMLNTKLRRN